YPPSIGEMQTHCFKLVQELKNNHRVHDLIWKSNYSRGIFFLTVVIRAWLRLKRNPEISVIYVNDGLMALICTPLLYFTKTPIVVTIHGLDVNFPSRIYQWWVRNYLNRFHRIITVSAPTTQLCLKKGIRKDKLVLVENAVDINFREEPENPFFSTELGNELGIDLTDKFIISSLGRAIPRKGFNWFTRNVCPELPENVVYFVIARKFPQEQLFRWIQRLTSQKVFEKIRLMVGAEIDGTAVNESIEELNLQGKVFRLSQFTDSRDKIFQIIKHSDLYVMPNIEIPGDYEGFGLVALEAASQGTLTLAANVDGIPSAVKDGVNGYLIEGGNVDEWVSRIKYHINNPEILKNKSEEFKKATITKGRSWENMAKNYVEVFRDHTS
ncbi:MAG: glycosyltransferase family 4 protein, partial [Marinoscillum sp.]